MRLDVQCCAAPFENTTAPLQHAINLAIQLAEEYQSWVFLRVNETGATYGSISPSGQFVN